MSGLEQAAVNFAQSIRTRRSSEEVVVAALEVGAPTAVLSVLADFERARVEEKAAENRYRDELTREAAG